LKVGDKFVKVAGRSWTLTSDSKEATPFTTTSQVRGVLNFGDIPADVIAKIETKFPKLKGKQKGSPSSSPQTQSPPPSPAQGKAKAGHEIKEKKQKDKPAQTQKGARPSDEKKTDKDGPSAQPTDEAGPPSPDVLRGMFVKAGFTLSSAGEWTRGDSVIVVKERKIKDTKVPLLAVVESQSPLTRFSLDNIPDDLVVDEDILR